MQHGLSLDEGAIDQTVGAQEHLQLAAQQLACGSSEETVYAAQVCARHVPRQLSISLQLLDMICNALPDLGTVTGDASWGTPQPPSAAALSQEECACREWPPPPYPHRLTQRQRPLFPARQRGEPRLRPQATEACASTTLGSPGLRSMAMWTKGQALSLP